MTLIQWRASKATADRFWIAPTNSLHQVLRQKCREDHRLHVCCRPASSGAVPQVQYNHSVSSSSQSESRQAVVLSATPSHSALPESTAAINCKLTKMQQPRINDRLLNAEQYTLHCLSIPSYYFYAASWHKWCQCCCK